MDFDTTIVLKYHNCSQIGPITSLLLMTVLIEVLWYGQIRGVQNENKWPAQLCFHEKRITKFDKKNLDVKTL